jgi:hypothetical protein
MSAKRYFFLDFEELRLCAVIPAATGVVYQQQYGGHACKIDQVMPLMRKAAATWRSRVVAIGVAQEYQRDVHVSTTRAHCASSSSYGVIAHRPARPPAQPRTASPRETPPFGPRTLLVVHRQELLGAGKWPALADLAIALR